MPFLSCVMDCGSWVALSPVCGFGGGWRRGLRMLGRRGRGDGGELLGLVFGFDFDVGGAGRRGGGFLGWRKGAGLTVSGVRTDLSTGLAFSGSGMAETMEAWMEPAAEAFSPQWLLVWLR